MKEIVLRPPTQYSEDWMLLVFIFSIAVVASTKALKPIRLSRLWNSSFNVRLMRQVAREEPNTPREYHLMSASYILLLSLLTYITLKRFSLSLMGFSGASLYLLLIGLFTIAYLLKIASLFLVSFLSQGDFGLSEYRHNISLLNRLTGFFLFPACLLAAYLPFYWAEYALFAGFVLFALNILYRALRGVVNALHSSVPLFYIFFYICTFEILPILIFYRALTL